MVSATVSVPPPPKKRKKIKVDSTGVYKVLIADNKCVCTLVLSYSFLFKSFKVSFIEFS